MKYKLLFLFSFLFILTKTNLLFSKQGGKIVGKVTDENNFSLVSANIHISELSMGTATDKNGGFIMDVPAGEYEIAVSYLGYKNEKLKVTVQENKTTYLELVLKAKPIIGDEVVVLGERLQGQAKALNQQKNNDNITNIVSSDQIGRFPDANIGDALKRIPAITVNYDQGEARFVNVRGTEPRFNSVTINGERIPSAEAEKRAVQVDLVPSDMIQTIEVNKTLTPDMDADAIGGSINLVTRQAPNKLRISGTLGSGYNFLSEKAQLIGSAVVGSRFLDNRLGVILSGSYFDHKLGSDNTEGVWGGDPGKYIPEDWEIRKYSIRRLRQSFGASLDFKLDPLNTIYFRGIYNHRNDWENRFRLEYNGIEETENGYLAEIRRQTKGGINNDVNDNARLEDQRMWTGSFSGEHIFGKGIKVDWDAALSKASEERPNERYIEWRQKNVLVQLDLSDTKAPKIIEGASYEKFSLKEITEEYQYTDEKDFNARLNFEIPFTTSGDYLNSLKFGGRYRQKDKKRENNFFEYSPLNEFENILAVGNSNYNDDNFLAGDYLIGSLTSAEELGSLDLNNSALFEKSNVPSEWAADNYNATEKIIAGYAMWKQTIKKNWLVTAGVRLENTKIDYTGNEFDENTEKITSKNGDDSYTNVLPNLQIKYNFAPNTILRFAWTNTLARPNYYDLVPYRAISEDNEELSVGNPALEPTKSMNFDLMTEHYYESIGLLSGGIFYKNIDDFIYIYSEHDYTDAVSGIVYDDYFQPRNGAEADLYGFEFAFQRRFDFLPGFLRNFDFYANYTYTDSKAKNPVFKETSGADEEIKLPGTTPHSLNTALTYQDGAIVLSISFNYSSSYLDPDDLDLTPGLERYYDAVTYLDINGSYAITPQLRFFFEANNLLNQPLRYYAGDSDRTYQAEYYNRRMSAGIKFDL